MTTLTLSEKKLVGPVLGPASRFPAMREPIKSEINSRLDDDDELFINYGMFQDSLPFTMQDNYDGPCAEQSFRTAILENRHIRATFLLDLGGRLWSLFDKDAHRDLITDNPQFRPNNLAIRSAWCAGGIEYNIGRRGHDEQTCSPRFAATLQDDDGTPVLRIYEFDRNRAVPFQMDFYLPEDARFLFARMRIANVNEYVVPMYWWSNIAVPMEKGQRIVVPAYSTYANCYNEGSHFITKIALPDGDGFDGTYPENFPAVRDYFFNIPDSTRKFEAVIAPDGYGLLFASTSRLQGRKMFVWGNNQGGRHWQRKLMGDAHDYLEIQGGLAKTQQECIPMPPHTAWEWLEAYGPINTKPDDVFGTWHNAVNAVTHAADTALPADALEYELTRTKATFALKRGKMICSGSGWGALEEKRLGHPIAPHLDFGPIQPEQADWNALLDTGSMPADTPPSGYMIQEQWLPILEKAHEPNWKILFSRALFAFRKKDYHAAEKLLEMAKRQANNPWIAFADANVQRVQGNTRLAELALAELLKSCPDDASLAKEALKAMMDMNGKPQRMLDMLALLTPDVRKRPLIRFCHAFALAKCGRLNEALNIITADGGLEIPDIREGESSISSLYIFIRQKLAASEGMDISEKDISVPFSLDLRMKI